jgi:hypothetical protein
LERTDDVTTPVPIDVIDGWMLGRCLTCGVELGEKRQWRCIPCEDRVRARLSESDAGS